MIFFFLGLLLLTGCKEMGNMNSIKDRQYNTVVINNQAFKEISDASLYKSISFGRTGETAEIFNDPVRNKEMVALFKKYGFESFRYHFPSISFWNIPSAKWTNQVTSIYSDTLGSVIDDKEFVKWLYDNGFKAAIQININLYYDVKKNKVFRLDINPEYIEAAAEYNAAFVAWVKEHGYQDSILYWELGNESYNPGLFRLLSDAGRWPGLTPQETAKVDMAFIKAIRKVEPSAKISIDGQSPEHPGKRTAKDWSGNVGQWHKEFLNSMIEYGMKDGDIDYLSQHCYAHWIKDVPMDTPMDIPPVEDAWKKLKKPIVSQIGSVESNVELLRSLGLANVKIQANEFKIGASRMWYQRTMMHALAQATPLFYFIKNPNVAGAVIHSPFNNADFALAEKPWKKHTLGWGIFIPEKTKGFIASPIAVMYQLIDILLQDHDYIINIQSSNESVATYGNNKLKFILVNKEDHSVTEKISLEGFTLAMPGQANIYTLKSENLDDFPVNPITKERKEFTIEKSKILISEYNIKYTLPKYSFVLFEIPNIKMESPEMIPFVKTTKHSIKQTDAKDGYDL